jgi:hypothetical protein
VSCSVDRFFSFYHDTRYNDLEAEIDVTVALVIECRSASWRVSHLPTRRFFFAGLF